MRLSALLPTVFATTTVILAQTSTPTQTPTEAVYSTDFNSIRTNYESLYSGHCAESTTSVHSVISRGIMWAPYTESTNLVTRTWTTIYPSPTPSIYPTNVTLTHISSNTGEIWYTASFGTSTRHEIATYVVVSFVYTRELQTKPPALVDCTTIHP